MRLLVVVHVYYEELWKELAESITCLPVPFALRVTCVQRLPEISAMVHATFPSAQVELVENRGFDIGPFLHVINSENLDDYDAVVKLHTKRNIPPHYVMRVNVEGSRFRDLLLNFSRSPGRWSKALDTLFQRDTGMVGEGKLMLNRFSDSLGKYEGVKAVMHHVGLSFRGGFFVAGSMFIVKSQFLKPFQGHFLLEDFEIPDRSKGDCLPHFLERALGYAVYAQGACLQSWDTKPFMLAAIAWRVGRFFFRVHHGTHHDIFHICGIPLWFRRHTRG